MSNDELRAAMLETMGLTNASKETQDEALYELQSIAIKRIGLVLPEILTDEQLDEIQAKRDAGESEQEVMDWVEKQVPDYDDMVSSIMQDVAAEVAPV